MKHACYLHETQIICVFQKVRVFYFKCGVWYSGNYHFSYQTFCFLNICFILPLFIFLIAVYYSIL